MSKQEFLNGLRAALNGRIPAPQVEDTLNYYTDYINVEVRKGRSEEEVFKSLGDPRLIARTIIQTNGSADRVSDAPGVDHREHARHEETYRDDWQKDDYSGYQGIHRVFRIPGWLLAIIVTIVIILVFCIIYSVLSFLAPLIIVIAAVVLLVKLFRDWLN